MAVRTVSEARATLPDLLTRVDGGEEIEITRHGRVVAVLVAPGVLRVRRAAATLAEAARLHDTLEEARLRPLSRTSGLAPGRADELVRELRAERDRDWEEQWTPSTPT